MRKQVFPLSYAFRHRCNTDECGWAGKVYWRPNIKAKHREASKGNTLKLRRTQDRTDGGLLLIYFNKSSAISPSLVGDPKRDIQKVLEKQSGVCFESPSECLFLGPSWETWTGEVTHARLSTRDFRLSTSELGRGIIPPSRNSCTLSVL